MSWLRRLLAGAGAVVGVVVLAGLVVGLVATIDHVKWDDFTADWRSAQTLTGLIVAVVGAFVGAGLAFLVAWWLFRGQVDSDRELARQQMEADRKLARDDRVEGAAHEIAGELALWCSEVRMPGAPDWDPSAAVARPIPVLIRRRATLATVDGFADVVDGAHKALEDFDAGIRILAAAVNRAMAQAAPAGARASADVTDREAQIWNDRFVPAIGQVRSLSTDLASWTTGTLVPSFETINLPDEQVCAMELRRATP